MQYNKKSVEDIDVSGKKVIVRCDFNVPQDENGNITDDKRIAPHLSRPSSYLLSHDAAVILCSHLGRPKGEVNMKYSLAPVGKAPVRAARSGGQARKGRCRRGRKEAWLPRFEPGHAVLLENVRFEKGETKNDAALAKAMADMAEIYVNDAFGTAHRAHASTAGVADYLPAVCGFLIKKEISIMGKASERPDASVRCYPGRRQGLRQARPSSRTCSTRCDTIIIGGGMAYTFLAAKGYGIGKSLFDAEKVDYCKDMMNKAETKGVKLLLPVDTVVAASFPNPIDAAIDVKTVSVDAIPADMEGMDIGREDRASSLLTL